MIDPDYLALTDTRCDGHRCVRAIECLRHIDRGAGSPWTPVTATLCAVPLRDTPHVISDRMYRAHLTAADVEVYAPRARRRHGG